MNFIQMLKFLYSENIIKIKFDDNIDYYSKNDLIFKHSGYFENVISLDENISLEMKSKTFKIWRDLLEIGKTRTSINFEIINDLFIARDFLIIKDIEAENHYKYLAVSLIKTLKNKTSDLILTDNIESLISQQVFPDNLKFNFENDIAYFEYENCKLSLTKLKNLQFDRILFFDCKTILKFEFFKPEYVRFLDICIRYYNIDEVVVLDTNLTINFRRNLALLSGIKKVTYPAFIMHRNNSSFTDASTSNNSIRDFRIVTRTIDINLLDNIDLPLSAESSDSNLSHRWTNLIGVLKSKQLFRKKINKN